MNSLDPFEERLRQIPFKEAPVSLRREILRAARASTAPERSDVNPIRSWFESWSWAHRVAWATLGFAWVVVLLLNFAAFEIGKSAPDERVQRRVSPALTAALREQRALLDRLLAEPSEPARLSTPGPDAGLWWNRRLEGSVV
jgi:hypothetical protein